MKSLLVRIASFLLIFCVLITMVSCSSPDVPDGGVEDKTGMDIFSFLDAYYWSMNFIRDQYGIEIWSGPMLDQPGETETSYHVTLPYCFFTMRKDGLALEKMTVMLVDFGAEELHDKDFMTVAAMFHALEGVKNESNFVDLLEIFYKSVNAVVGDLRAISSLEDGGKVQFYSGNYSYSLVLGDTEATSDKKYLVEIEAN